MLKWFKRIKERFFEDEELRHEYEEYTEIEDEQIDDIEEQSAETRRPSFRFPIISDAEIYGWEDERDEKPEELRPIVTEESIDFEPTPLHQLERWPQQQKMKIHRVSPEISKWSFNEDPVESQRPLHEQFEREVHSHQRRRFEPTKVPSPIFGYKKPNRPKRVQRHEDVLPRAKEKQSENPQNRLFMDHVKAITTYPEATDLQTIVPEEMAIKEPAMDTVSSVHKNHKTSTEEHSKQVEVLVEEANDEAVVVEEAKDTVVEASIDIPTAITPVLEERMMIEPLDTPTVDESLVEAFVEEVVHDQGGEEQASLIEQVALPEEVIEVTSEVGHDLVEEADSHPEAVEVEERVVPFNVLMLKSDKQRLVARQIRDEELEKQQHKQGMLTSSVEAGQLEEPKDHSSVVADQVIPEELEMSPEIPPIVETVQEEEGPLTEEERLAHYVLPSLDYLEEPEVQVDDEEWLRSQSEKLEESLSHFGVQATVIEAVQGPTVTSFELTVVQGTKVSRIRNLTDDLKLALAARDIRIQAPIPGKSSIGIEIPNKIARPVRISEVIQSTAFERSDSPMEAVLGLGLTGDPVTLDLRKMPHGLIAGATGSGKSVCINSILVSLLYKASPVDLKMMLIDPKMVELAPYNGIPHLISPVITDIKAATAALKWAVQEMDRRYELLAHAGVRNIEAFNKKADDHRQFAQKMPYLLIVIDELADLMMMAPADVEISISRIAQKARACGIHLIIATQRPSVDVITGIIKANIPTRIAFSVSSQVDSRTMMDTNGAERLLGKGDMLYIGNGESTAVRLQGTFVTDEEIDRIIEHVQNEASPNYLFGQEELLKSAVEEDEDPLFIEACEFIYAQDSASTSMLQRNFSIGYNRAAKLMDRLESLAYISPQQGSKARDVYLTEQTLSELKESAF